jgi:hypothetical protein
MTTHVTIKVPHSEMTIHVTGYYDKGDKAEGFGDSFEITAIQGGNGFNNEFDNYELLLIEAVEQLGGLEGIEEKAAELCR